MQITGENGLEKDGSYQKLRPKQKKYEKNGKFSGYFLCEIG